MKSIEIDFDVHRMIELERRGFDEPENNALRRLLKLPEKLESGTAKPVSRNNDSDSKTGWRWKGVFLPDGTELRMEYAGQIVTGRVEHGSFEIEGRRFNSPSDAAGSSVLTKDGSHPSLNGWNYWEIKRPSDVTWRRLASLKPR